MSLDILSASCSETLISGWSFSMDHADARDIFKNEPLDNVDDGMERTEL